MDHNQLCLEVANIARQAGHFIRQEALHFDRNQVRSKGAHDFVSYVDQESEKLIVTGLRELLPNAGFITEEGTVEVADYSKTFMWIIDPLDGTTNFIHGLPCYSVSIALMQNSELVIGVIYEVNLDECFRAVRGGGAYCNDKLLHVSNISEMNQALIVTGFPFNGINKVDIYISILTDLLHSADGVRRIGSAAMALACVAAGRFDGYFEFNINSYDVAAGILLVREAGGVVTEFLENGNPIFNRQILATNGRVHMEMQKIIGKHWKQDNQIIQS